MSRTMQELLEEVSRAEAALTAAATHVRAVGEEIRTRDALPSGITSGPLGYITAAGITRVPQFVLDHLGLPHGGGVVFLRQADGTVQVLTNGQFVRSFCVVPSDPPQE